jgi:hypothetical protein
MWDILGEVPRTNQSSPREFYDYDFPREIIVDDWKQKEMIRGNMCKMLFTLSFMLLFTVLCCGLEAQKLENILNISRTS